MTKTNTKTAPKMKIGKYTFLTKKQAHKKFRMIMKKDI